VLLLSRMAFLFALFFALFVVALSACVMGLGLLAVAAIFGTIRNDRNSNKIGREPPRPQPRRRI
jgi:hypothetical protein